MGQTEQKTIQYFSYGNAVHPLGRVIEDKEGVTKEYTLEEWAELQSQSQE